MESSTPTLELEAGLPARELHRRLQATHRATDLGHRALAFYLHDMSRRGLHLLFSCSSPAHYAETRLGLAERTARELVQLGGRLLELPAVDQAFADGVLSWSKVRLLCRVVDESTEAAWIERAADLSCRRLEQQVRQCAPGDAPPGARGLGLPELQFSVEAKLSVLEQQLWEKAKEKLGSERGRPPTDAELMRYAAELVLGERDATGPGSRSRYQVIVHRCPDCGESTVDSEVGRVALDSVETGVVACDAERITADGGRIVDESTSPQLRRAVLARDGGQCLHCGSRVGLHAHHVRFRSRGGATRPENLCVLCGVCHALVHQGLLAVTGTAPHGLEFAQCGPGAGEPAVEVARMLVTGDRGTRVPDVGPEPPDLDRLPDVVDGKWFWDHEHLFSWRLAPPGRRVTSATPPAG